MQVFKIRKSLEAITKLKKTKAEKAKLIEEKLREVIKIYKEVTEKIRNMVENEGQLTTLNAEAILDALQHLTEYLYSKYESYTKIEKEAIEVAESAWSFDKWRKEGRKEGKIEGRKESQTKIAQKFLKMGLTVEQVVQGTELSEEEVMEIKKRLIQ